MCSTQTYNSYASSQLLRLWELRPCSTGDFKFALLRWVIGLTWFDLWGDQLPLAFLLTYLMKSVRSLVVLEVKARSTLTNTWTLSHFIFIHVKWPWCFRDALCSLYVDSFTCIVTNKISSYYYLSITVTVVSSSIITIRYLSICV